MKPYLPWILSTLMAGTALALEIEVVPGFESASLYLHESGDEQYSVRYRSVADDTWLNAPPLSTTENLPLPRLSLLGLSEATDYEIEILSHDQTVATAQFRTLDLNVPIARTITLKGDPVTITEHGSPEGWIRYVADRTVDGGMGSASAIHVNDASYIILEGITVTGGIDQAILIQNSSHIRVINCDISGWGEKGTRNYRSGGYFFGTKRDAINRPHSTRINRQAGIHITRSENILVERCYIHDPRGTANSWVVAHPAGPCAIYVVENQNTTIRYNDFIGSDQHRWNDVIESAPNSSPEGGFHRDAEIYGNLLCYGNDDSMELDGGQMNMRVWGNWIEGTFAGISTAPCIYGPSYLYNNLIANPGDRYGLYGYALKNNFRFRGEGQIYFVHNTVVGGAGISPLGAGDDTVGPFLTIANNVIVADALLMTQSLQEAHHRAEHNLLWHSDPDYLDWQEEAWSLASFTPGIIAPPHFKNQRKGHYQLAEGSTGSDLARPLQGFPPISTAAGVGTKTLPLRPTALHLSHARIELTAGQSAIVEADLDHGDPQGFHILKNEVFDWFTVETDTQTLAPGQPATLKINLTHAPAAPLRGAFIVKLADGFSRPIIVTAGPAGRTPLEPTGPGWAQQIAAVNTPGTEHYEILHTSEASAGVAVVLPAADSSSDSESIQAAFDVPEDNVYYLAVRCYSPTSAGTINSLLLSINGEPFESAILRLRPGEWNWAGLARPSKHRGHYEPIQLKQGRVFIELKPDNKPLTLDAILLMESPAAIYGDD